MHIFSLLFACFVLAVPAIAQEYKGTVEENIPLNHCQILSTRDSPLIDKVCLERIQIRYSIYTLMGEPVGAYAVAWTLDPTLYLRRGGVDIYTQPPKVRQAFYDLVPVDPTRFYISAVTAKGNGYGGRVFFRFDGGALKRSGKGFSFNTPGSPDWDRFLLTTPPFMIERGIDPSFMDKKVAKGTFEHLSGFAFADITHLTFNGIAALNEALATIQTKSRHSAASSQPAAIDDTFSKLFGKDTEGNNTAGKNIKPPDTAAKTARQTSVDGSILMLIDVSGSMAGEKLSQAKKAALSAIDTAVANRTEVAILTFSGSCQDPIRDQTGFTQDREKLEAFVDGLRAGGGTPLGSALKEANHFMAEHKSPSSKLTMILLLADGDGQCGNVPQVLDTLKGEGITFRHETIGLGIDPGSDAARDLRKIAAATGGDYHHADKPKQLTKVFTEALDSTDMMDLIGHFDEETPRSEQMEERRMDLLPDTME